MDDSDACISDQIQIRVTMVPFLLTLKIFSVVHLKY